ncbi:hypothetical protein QE152_g26377 [Popillia japonica]|uniref:Uncharacterized protein n=1 Tax=Popillia japonica TaxID=7064 RepID=A0AAW1JYF0_POPJA
MPAPSRERENAEDAYRCFFFPVPVGTRTVSDPEFYCIIKFALGAFTPRGRWARMTTRLTRLGKVDLRLGPSTLSRRNFRVYDEILRGAFRDKE